MCFFTVYGTIKAIMVNKNKQTHRTKRFKIAALVVLVLLLLGGGLFLYHRSHHKMTSPTATGTKPEINYRPPTKEEKQAANDAKQRIVSDQKAADSAPTTSGTSGLKQVTPVISYASTETVNSSVSGVFEDGGTCTATFTQGATIITRTSTGFENVSDTQCAPITPDLPNTNPWSVIIKYTSATSQGSSKSVEIK